MSLISSKRNFLSELVSATLRSGFFVTICDPSETGRSLGAGRALLARKMAVFMAEVRKMTVPARK